MGWSLAMRHGALLSALVTSDTDLARARSALSAAELDGLRSAMASLEGETDRRVRLTALAKSTRPAPSVNAITSPRERALLASSLAERDIAEGWLEGAPAVRRGYRPPRGLVRTLVHAARAPASAPAHGDRGRGRALLAALVRRADDGARQELLAGIGPDEAASILALAVHPTDLDPPSAALRTAASVADGDARVDALGALSRGAAIGDVANGAPPLDPFVRAGRELTELGLVAPGAG